MSPRQLACSGTVDRPARVDARHGLLAVGVLTLLPGLVSCGRAPADVPPPGPPAATTVPAETPASAAPAMTMTMAPGERGEEIPAGDPIPTLTLHDHGYASGVWSFTLETDLQLTMDTAPYESMRGHVHVYVDGTETAMIARKQFTVPHLSPGRHIVRVALAATDHRTLLHDGAPIADEATVVVPSP